MDYTRNEDKLFRSSPACNRLIDIDILEDDDVDEPVTLDEVKANLAIDFTDNDALLTMLIKAARANIEKYCGLSLVEKFITLHINNSEGNFELPYGPIIGDPFVTTDEDVEITNAKFSGIYFKSLRSPTYNEVRLQYSVGYDPVPGDLKLAVLHEVAYLFEHRGDESEREGLSPIAKGYAKKHRRVPSVL